MNKKEVFQKMINDAATTKERIFYSAVYLFSTKGFANVGIRELCRSVDIKESALYNHYKSKEDLFLSILEVFKEASSKVVFSDEEIESAVQSGDIALFFKENMKKFSYSTNNPLYHTILQIILMESYTNAHAHDLARSHLYYLRRDYTEKVLRGMMDNGDIKECDVEVVTAEYYYGLKGLLDEYLLREVWNEDTDVIMKRIEKHIAFFVEILKK
ncbi:TetR/AcrR family transcriptional regulator [Metallumcola ferriviriculae]|uniref:TetR/AcrR family transcriptional regulator n=1 Tax=Metallumcola ferriviriculae TaxID=3039180 RepID=A0AAU0UMH3_9FIRM|nr:TetR/AcrR family transcriptional regulator [Desulfitibacteraceae bacterium MK1]